MNRAALIQALPPAARAMCKSKYIDPANAFLAHAEGLTLDQARSRARNAARSFGQSWPDRLPSAALVDPDDVPGLKGMLRGARDIFNGNPIDFLIALQAAQAALEAADCAQKLEDARKREVDTQAVAHVFKITRRRAQQVKKAALAAADAGQADLFCEGEEEEGGKP